MTTSRLETEDVTVDEQPDPEAESAAQRLGELLDPERIDAARRRETAGVAIDGPDGRIDRMVRMGVLLPDVRRASSGLQAGAAAAAGGEADAVDHAV